MLVLEVMSLFMLGLLGTALPTGSSDDDDDEDRSENNSAEADARAAATEDTGAEGEGGSLLDHVFAEDLDYFLEDDGAAPDAAQMGSDDPWQQDAGDADYQAVLDEIGADAGAETDGETGSGVLAAVARLTAASDATAAAPDEDREPDEEQADDRAEADTGDEDEDSAAAAPGDLSVTTIVDYQPGSDQIEITIFAPPPDTAVDVVLQQTADGTGTEVLIAGKLRAILDGVLPGDVDANDLYIEFAG